MNYDEIFANNLEEITKVVTQEARKHAFQPQDIDDLIQLSLLEVRKSLRRFKEDYALGAWVRTTAKQTIWNYNRKDKRENTKRNLLLHEQMVNRPTIDDPATQLKAAELSDNLRRNLAEALGRLPEIEGRLILLCYIENLRGEEKAKLLNWEVTKVYRTIRRAKEKLDRILTELLPAEHLRQIRT